MIRQNFNTSLHCLLSYADLPTAFMFLDCGHRFRTSVQIDKNRYTVEEKNVGSAYGIATAIQNCGLSLGPIIAAAVTNTTEEGKHYRLLNFIQIGESGIGLAFGIWLWYYDLHKGGGILSASSQDAAKM